MTRSLAAAAALALALGATTSAQAQTATPTTGLYEGLMLITGSTACNLSPGTNFLTARLNYPASGSLDFATYGFGSSGAFVLPVMGTGTGTVTTIGDGAAAVASGAKVPYSGLTVAVLDPATNVISFTVTVVYSTSCSLTYAGSMFLRPA
jgi:hypothetical protein